MICAVCGYDENNGDEKMIGIFPTGTSLYSTKGTLCGIYACPKCSNVVFTDNIKYINNRKDEYKKMCKNR